MFPCYRLWSSYTFIYTFYPWIKMKDKISHDRKKFHPWNFWKIKKSYPKIKKVLSMDKNFLSFNFIHQYHLYLHTVPKSKSVTLNQLPKKTKPIFSILDDYWICPHPQIFCTSLDLGGAAIIFSQNQNFELKFFLVNPLMSKIGSTRFLDSKKPKNE